MSFSNDVKTELSRRIDEERLCRIAELSAVIRFAGRIDREKPEIEIHTENVMLAKKYESKITICKEGGEPVNAKSVVRLLAEGIGQGTKAELAAEGPDEAEAIEALAGLVASGFGE